MGTARKQRLAPREIQADHKTLIGLRSLMDYAPRNGAYNVSRLAELYQTMLEAQEAEQSAVKALGTARSAAIKAARAFHEGILGVKAEVIAQYGADSEAVRTAGLRPKSERRRPARRDNGTNGTNDTNGTE